MLNYQNKILTKLIALILTQVFLLTVCPEPVSSNNIYNIYIQDRCLRVPLNPLTYEKMNSVISGFRDNGSELNFSDLNLDNIEQAFPVFGRHIRSAVNFLGNRTLQEGKPFLDGISNIKIITGSDTTSAEQSGNELIIKLGDMSFLTSGFEQETFLYFLYTLASAKGTFGEGLDPQGPQADPILILKDGDFERVTLKGRDMIFMLVANFKKDGNRNKMRQHIGLFSDTAQEFNVYSTIIQDGACIEASSRRFRMPFDKRLWVGVPPGCEIFRFTPRENPVFRTKDILEIFGVSPDLKEVLSFFVAAGIFEEKRNADIHRVTMLNGKDEKISAYITTTDAKELIINVPLNRSPDLAETVEVIAAALGKKDIIHQVAKAGVKMNIGPKLTEVISKVQKNIDRTREPMFSAIKAVWDRKIYIYKEMTKERASDTKNAEWVKKFAPYLKDKVIVSWQMEMGFHPELSFSLIEVLQEEVDKGNMTIEEADNLFKKTAMSTMAGGLGALMPDWLRALADNGANVVSLNLIYKTYEYQEKTGEWLKKALHRMADARIIEGLEARLKDGSTRKINLHICHLGKAIQIWIEEMEEQDKTYISGKLYENHQDSPERLAQMDFYNAAGQTAFKWLKENKIKVVEATIKDNNTFNLLNEVYTYLPKKTGGEEIPVNHTVVETGIPFFFSEYLKGVVDEETLRKITDKNGKAHLEVLALMKGARVLGVSKDHTKILNRLFSIWIDNVVDAAGFTQDEKSMLLSKIVRDEKYNSSNGAHPKHFEAPEIQDLIEKYKKKLGNVAMDDDEFRMKIQQQDKRHAQLEQRFAEELDDIIFGLQKHLVTLLRSQGQALEWEPSKEIPTGGIIRRIVDYKELIRFVEILQNETIRERFVKSGVRIIVGGRFNQVLLNHIKKLTEIHGLKNQVVVFEDYNISDAPIILQGENFTVMLSRKGEEAAATSPQKKFGPVIAVRDGICHESEGFLGEFNPKTGEGNGFVVKYGEDGRPLAESLLECFEKMSSVYKVKTQRQQIQFNGLMKGLEFNEVTHQARGTLNIINEISQEKNNKILKDKTKKVKGSIANSI